MVTLFLCSTQTFWDPGGDVLSNYSLAYIFGQYLSIHSYSGVEIFKEILDYMVEQEVFDYSAVENTVSDSIANTESWAEVFQRKFCSS